MQLWRIEVMRTREMNPARKYLKVEAETGPDAMEIVRRHLGDYSTDHLEIMSGYGDCDSSASSDSYRYAAYKYDEPQIEGRVV